MANEQPVFPMIPVKHWWAIRKRLQQSMPGALTPSFLASVLRMKEVSARTNVIPSLMACGLLDEDNKLTARANQWRDDKMYSKVCEEIRTDVYPQELRDAIQGPDPSSEDAVRWFTTKRSIGISAARRYAAVYILLTEADVSKAVIPDKKRSAKPKPNEQKRTKPKSAPKLQVQDETGVDLPEMPNANPSLHIDIQIHIAPEATAEQIEKIFEAMGKHIFKR